MSTKTLLPPSIVFAERTGGAKRPVWKDADMADESALDLLERRTLEYATKFLVGEMPVGREAYGPVVDELRLVKRRVEVLEAEVAALKERDSTDDESVAPVAEVARVVSILQRSFEIEDAGAVVRHFLSRESVLQFFVKTAEKVPAFFNAGARCSLRCDDDDELLLEITTPLTPDEGELRYSKFLREWWMPLGGHKHRVTVSLNYAA